MVHQECRERKSGAFCPGRYLWEDTRWESDS
jgi:hypothetical protein